MARATMAEVAKRAGVSKATVSHVINNTRFVSEEIRNTVLSVIQELDYTPSHIARSLTVQRTHTAGLLVTDVGNPFYHDVILGIEDVALANDYSVYLFNASYDTERSLRYISSMLERRADGIILMSSQMTKELLEAATRHGVPTVVLDWNEFDVQQAGAISFDFGYGIYQAVGHLCSLGHTRFAHVSGDLNLWTARIRRDLFLQALSEHGIDPLTVEIIEGDFSIDGGKRALHQLIRSEDHPTAVFSVNDMTAIGLVFEADKLGLSVPRDLSIVGFDDILLASQINPALSTIALPRRKIGEFTMSILLDLIAAENNIDAEPDRFRKVIKPELVLRESTAPPSHGTPKLL